MRVADLIAATESLPRHEVIRLVQLALGGGRSGLVANPEMTARDMSRFRTLLARRVSGEPLQYIEGTVDFGPIVLHSDNRALIPRPETERLWELAVELVADRSPLVIVDLCTGSGNLALALKAIRPDAVVVATDVSAAAISLAEENALSLDLDVDFRRGDLFSPLDPDLRGAVDLIVSNPPYIAADEWLLLPDEVRDYEPEAALIAGVGGVEILERIALGAHEWLSPGGHIICEIGETQAAACLRLFADFEPEIVQDLAHRDRYVVGCAPQERKLH